MNRRMNLRYQKEMNGKIQFEWTKEWTKNINLGIDEYIPINTFKLK